MKRRTTVTLLALAAAKFTVGAVLYGIGRAYTVAMNTIEDARADDIADAWGGER